MPTISFEAREAKRDLENKVVPARAAALPFKKVLREVFIRLALVVYFNKIFFPGVKIKYYYSVLGSPRNDVPVWLQRIDPES
jgi:hypothetical protein